MKSIRFLNRPVSAAMTTAAALALVLIGAPSSALAYKDGTYTCHNGDGLPANVYTFQTVNIGGISHPHLDITRHFRKSMTDPNSPIVSARIKGFAMLLMSDNVEVLMLGNLRYEFNGDKLLNCR